MKWLLAMGLALLLLMNLTGCFIQSGEDFYSLPEAPEEYYDLQEALSAVLATGAEYAAPVTGTNRQSTQSVDLDGDGEKEVVAFFRSADDASLEVYIFDKQGESYVTVAMIPGTGSAIDSVEYVQLDGESGLEIIVGWEVSNSTLQYMGVYSVKDWQVTDLMSNVSYSEYCTVDLDDDGCNGVFLVKFDSEQRTGVAQLYVYDGVQMEKKTDAAISTGVESLKRIVTGYIEGDVPAVLVAGDYGESGIVTDIFVLRNDAFVNICSEDGTELSSQTVRNYYVYATDIDYDGVYEIPQPEELSIWPTDSTETFSIINWYGIQINGTMIKKLITFHNYSAGWYIELPEAWDGEITVYRETSQSGLWTYVFAWWDDETQTADPIFSIHAFSGEDRESEAAQDELTRLSEISDVVYAAEIFDESVTEEDLSSWFHTILTDWNTGET